MILRNLEKYKVGVTEEAVTSFAGLPLFLQMGKSMGLEKSLNELRIKERERGYKPAEVGLALMGLLQSGGEALDDIELLRGDEGMRVMMGEMPAANTVGEYLRRFGEKTIYELGRKVMENGVKVVLGKKLKRVTLDVDAFTVESQKAGVEMNYKGEWGYTPIAVSCGELKMPLAGIFRGGSASAGAHVECLLRRVIEGMPKGIELCVRSDSAGYQAKVVKLCEEKGCDFVITARQDESVMESIRSIPEKRWRGYEDGAYPNRLTEIAETVHAFGDKETKAHRLVVVRWKKEREELWGWEYHGVLTSMEEWEAERVLSYYRERQDRSENMNKELVYGFGLEKLPCREMKANAAYFQFVLLASVVAAAVKHLVLPESWRTLTMKTMRFRLIRLAGYVSRHARRLWLKIPKGYVYREAFEAARWRIMGLSVELSHL